jgi:copper chaperone
METTVIKVCGMSCGGCVKTVTGVLSRLPGVAKVEVSLEKAQAVIEFDPAQSSPARLAQAVADAGFETD